MPDPRLARGVADFNAGAFYEAHEAWEELWNDSEGDTKRAVQALVQLAAGYHKRELGVPGGAMKLLSRALGLLDTVPATTLPIALAPLRATVREHLATLRATPTAALEPPRLRLEVGS